MKKKSFSYILFSLGLLFFLSINILENEELVKKISENGGGYLFGIFSSDNSENSKLQEELDQRHSQHNHSSESDKNFTHYAKGNIVSDYKLFVKFEPEGKRIEVNQSIIWRNKTSKETDRLYFHLYPNAYSNLNTYFMSGKYKFENSESEKEFLDKHSTELKIENIFVNEKPVSLKYYNNEVNSIKSDLGKDFTASNKLTESAKQFPINADVPLHSSNISDKTVGYIVLNEPCVTGDSVLINIKYRLKIPEAIGRFGHSANQNVYFFAQWFPKLGVYDEKFGWICSPFYQYTEFFSDFSNYEIIVEHPKIFRIASSGYVPELSSQQSESLSKNKVRTRIIRENAIDFAFAALKEIEVLSDTFKRKDGSLVEIFSFYQPHNQNYKGRGISALKTAMRFMEKYFGIYNYSTITMVDIPKNSGTIANMEYPALFTYKTKYFSFEDAYELEQVIIHEFIHQYFYAIVATNEVYEAWLDEGIANYLTSKILQENYREKTSYFNLFGYYPVRGLLLLEIADIPVIYTLSNIKSPFITESLSGYYRYPDYGSIADTSFRLLNQKVYNAVTYSKAEILFHTIERFLGEKEFFRLLSKYYTTFSYRHPRGDDFWNLILTESSKDLSFVYEGFYKDVSITDYRLSDIKVFDDHVEVIVQKTGTSQFPTEVFVYTDKDTLKTIWDAKENVEKIVFNTNDFSGKRIKEIKGAEIDPYRKNLFDVNFANNSKLINIQISGGLSIALRWFFWIQNLLMISGGLV